MGLHVAVEVHTDSRNTKFWARLIFLGQIWPATRMMEIARQVCWTDGADVCGRRWVGASGHKVKVSHGWGERVGVVVVVMVVVGWQGK